MEGVEASVVLVVKAPNQQIEDQTVHCELGWTIRRLKAYLSEVYPSKPKLEDQKLIYSGQLLSDTVVLKDVLRTYEGQKNYTLHLVCSPSRDVLKRTQNEAATGSLSENNVRTGNSLNNADNTTPTNIQQSQDGLRQRVGYVYNDAHPAFVDPRTVWAQYNEAQTSWIMPPTYDPAYMAQQMAWMQQAYAQYMSQYMQLVTSGSSVSNTNTALSQPVQPPVQPVVPPAAVRDEAAVPNNVIPNGEPEEEEVRANRDWLEWFYIVSRVLVLFSIVYFYSSPIRFFMVSTLGIIMYLYHLGFFRGMQQERPDPQPEIPPAPQEGVDNNNVEPAPNPAQDEGSPAPPEPDRPSLLALTWSVFSSFFLSLIPDQPNNVL
uniref:Ubiquitin-like domain-containing protein n=1 Tax=Clastoptera arizonana TaxID=38151 RepID=A0A1B6D3D0_9HEMI